MAAFNKVLQITFITYFLLSLMTPFSVIWFNSYYLQPECFVNTLVSLFVAWIFILFFNWGNITIKSLEITPFLITLIVGFNLAINKIFEEQFYNLIYIASIAFVFTAIKPYLTKENKIEIETPLIIIFILILVIHITMSFLKLSINPISNSRVFSNYGQYSNYIALFFPFFASIFFFRIMQSKLDKILKISSFFLSLIILTTLIVNNIRTAWIPCLLFLLFCYFKNTVFNWFNKYQGFDKIKQYKIVVFSFLILFFILLFSYYLKKDSADGRLFIWCISWQIFLDNPWTGVGFNHFQSHYILYQANYFKTHTDPQNAWLASDVFFAFNETLQNLVEFGVIAVGLWAFLFYQVRKTLIGMFSSWHVNPLKQWLCAGYLGFILILLFQIFFSYPFKDQSSTHTIFILNLFYITSFSAK